MEHDSYSENDTARIAEALGAELRRGSAVLLSGSLGAGKSVFARALVRSLCNNPALEVPSPTFTLVQTYDTSAGPLAHFDLYRLKDPEEVRELGWEDALAEGIVLVEWPERLGFLKPARRIEVAISPVQGRSDARRIRIERHD